MTQIDEFIAKIHTASRFPTYEIILQTTKKKERFLTMIGADKILKETIDKNNSTISAVPCNSVNVRSPEDTGCTINISVNPVVIVEGSRCYNSSFTSEADNRVKTNPSLGEVGTFASTLAGLALAFMGK